MFESSSPFAPFDYFRVPYTVTAAAGDSLPAGWARLRADVGTAGTGASLLWPTAPGRGAWAGLFRVAGSTLGGHVVRQAPHGMFPGRGGDWRPIEEVRDRSGAHIAWVWRHSDGDTWLPFDPDNWNWHRVRIRNPAPVGTPAASVTSDAVWAQLELELPPP